MTRKKTTKKTTKPTLAPAAEADGVVEEDGADATNGSAEDIQQAAIREMRQRAAACEAEVQAVRELTQKRRQQLEQVSTEAVSKVERALFEVLTKIAEERGLNVVLPTSQVLFFSRQIDLTDEVLAQLNATLSEVPVTDRVD